MTSQDLGIEAFAAELAEETNLWAEDSSNEAIETAFAAVMIDYMIAAGEIDAGEVCRHRATGVEVSGYNADSDEGRLDLFVTLHTGAVPPVTVTKDQVETAIRRLRTFLVKARSDYHTALTPASAEADMASTIHEMSRGLSQVRLFILTDGLATMSAVPAEVLHGADVSVHIWDLRRLYRCVTSGQGHEPIEIDFVARYGNALPCLSASGSDGEYSAFLAIIPASVLADLYEEFGPRLLELNVRSFLQARGKVNRGIRDTILNEPERFLAYNNGISVTADEIRLAAGAGGGDAIAWTKGLQIVNGGQTTASLYQAGKKDRADLTQISVQAKISVVTASLAREMVPLISRYANSQNSINEADFSANDPFHVKLEELSRSVWAPPIGGSQRQTRWFYERARGQYLDARGRARTPAQRRAFDAEHPRAQMFTKTDLAKFENTWDQLPHVVSRGAQKNFAEFTLARRRRGAIVVDAAYFHRLVAKAILFRRCERIVGALHLGGYRANIVTYSLAYVFHKTSQRVDLDAIWREQDVPESIELAIQTVAPEIYRQLTEGAAGRNVTEWCKTERCWDSVRTTELTLPEGLQSELLSVEQAVKIRREPETLDPETKDAIDRVSAVPAETWFSISKWAKETGNLAPWQRGLSFSLGRAVGGGRAPSPKQAIQGLKILEEATRLGFEVGKG